MARAGQGRQALHVPLGLILEHAGGGVLGLDVVVDPDSVQKDAEIKDEGFKARQP